MFGSIAAFWGYAGILLIFSSAIYRLGAYALQMFEQPLMWYHWLALAISIGFMGFAEGYKGFQKGFSPRVAARIRYLSENVTPVRAILAPLFCMGFFHITRRRQIVTFCLSIGIILLIQVVHHFAQPWRGIVDAGVVLGLTWGIVSLTLYTVKAFWGVHTHSPEVPA
jgi:ABC-type branched-subunit amino acid transport system permease subunit